MYVLKPKESRVNLVGFLISFEFLGVFYYYFIWWLDFFFPALEIVSVVKQDSGLVWFFMSSFQHPQRHLIVQDILSICTYRNQASSGTPLKARHREAKISFQKVSGFHFSVSQGLFQGPSRWLGDLQNGNLWF